VLVIPQEILGHDRPVPGVVEFHPYAPEDPYACTGKKQNDYRIEQRNLQSFFQTDLACFVSHSA